MKNFKLKDDFSNIEDFENLMPNKLILLWGEFQKAGQNGYSYTSLIDWKNRFSPYGLSFDYGLDAEPYDFELTIKD